MDQAWWCMSVIPALRRMIAKSPRSVRSELKGSLACSETLSHSVQHPPPTHTHTQDPGFLHNNQPAGVSFSCSLLDASRPRGEYQPTLTLLSSLQAWPRLWESSSWSRSQPLGSSIFSSPGSVATACASQGITTTLRHICPTPATAQDWGLC